MQWLGIFALVATLIGPSVAIAQDASPAASGGGVMVGAFDVGPGSCPECPNPLQAGAGFTWYEKYFSKLMLYASDFSGIEGDLAESWELNEDATQYTIHLRDGVTWHDGQPFTSKGFPEEAERVGKGTRAGTRSLPLSGAFGGLLGAVPSDQFLATANDYLARPGWVEGFATAVG